MAAAAIYRIEVEVGGPGGIVLLVKVKRAAPRVDASLFGIFGNEPGLLPLYGVVIPEDRRIDHDGKLVTVSALFDLRP